MIMFLLITLISQALLASATTSLYFSPTTDLPFLHAKAQRPFFKAVLKQYEKALNGELLYSAGGVLSNVANCSGCGWRHQLAASLYVANYGSNSSYWGQVAKKEVISEMNKLTPQTGNWFAGSERNLEQLIGSYSVLASLFSPQEITHMEEQFALNAQYMYAAPPFGLGVAADMASRLMNPAADRLAAVGLIALTFPHLPNATKWLAQSVREFKWMLANGVMEDGAWHEPSTRYHGRVLAAFVPFAYALRQAKIMDAFNEIDSFKKFVGWYRLIQTPPDATMSNCSLTPALSDGNWETVWEVSMGWSAGAYIQTDPTYANALFGGWENACAPMGLEPSPPAMLSSFLFIGCVRESDGCGERYSVPFATAAAGAGGGNAAWLRRSTLLSGYAVLEDPTSLSNPYLILTTSTQRQTEGHEHPDRGSFSLYHGGVPLVLDPGVGWCGYNWFGTIPSQRSNGTSFDTNLTFGAWYRGSQSHSMVNFATEGPNIKPENETWRPAGAYGHEWGLRGEAWVTNHVFSTVLDYVDVNITRAVQESQLNSVQSYHRIVFANKMDSTYLFWDDITTAHPDDCAKATYNLHVVTQKGWPGVVGCQSNSNDNQGTKLICTGLNGMNLDVNILHPANASQRDLIQIEADPLPVQFTGMTGSAGATATMPAFGGALGGDWNAAGNLAPEKPFYPPRTPTWIRLTGRASGSSDNHNNDNANDKCTGFLTLLQPRNSTTKSIVVERVDRFENGATTVETSYDQGGTIYLLGSRPPSSVDSNEEEELIGRAGVVGWTSHTDDVTLVQGTLLSLPKVGIRVHATQNVTMTIRSSSVGQYVVRVQSPVVSTAMLTLTLPWKAPAPMQINVWRGSHVWHVTNTTLGSGVLSPEIVFEALPGHNYLIERFCVRSMKAGYNDGKGGWLCDPTEGVESFRGEL